MNKFLIQDSDPAGLALFSGAETFLRDLSEEEEAIISGGKRSNSNSRRRPRRRRRRRARSVSQS